MCNDLSFSAGHLHRLHLGIVDGSKAVGHHDSLCDVVADMILAKQFVNTCVNESGTDIILHTREHYVYILLMRRLDEDLKVMDTGRVNKRDAAHTYDTHFRFTADSGTHHLVKFRSDSEEERAVYLIDLNTRIDIKHFMDGRLRSLGDVKLLRLDLYLRILHNTTQEQYYSPHQTHLYCDGEIEDHGEKECHCED